MVMTLRPGGHRIVGDAAGITAAGTYTDFNDSIRRIGIITR